MLLKRSHVCNVMEIVRQFTLYKVHIAMHDIIQCPNSIVLPLQTPQNTQSCTT